MFTFHVNTNSFKVFKLTIAEGTPGGYYQRDGRMNVIEMSLEIRPRFNNIVTKAAMEGFPLRVFTNNRHGENVIPTISFMLFNTMNTQATLRVGNKITVCAFKVTTRGERRYTLLTHSE